MTSILLLAAPPALLPIRVLAGVALVAVIVAFIYVWRHFNQIERTIKADEMIPAAPGARTNTLLLICAIPIVIVSLLVFLILKA